MCPCAVERAVPCAPSIVNFLGHTPRSGRGPSAETPAHPRDARAAARGSRSLAPGEPLAVARSAALPADRGEDAATCEPSEHSNLFTGVILMAVINTLKRLQTLHSR